MFKVNNRNTRTRCEICSELTIKTPGRRQWRVFYCSSVSFVNFEQVNPGWDTLLKDPAYFSYLLKKLKTNLEKVIFCIVMLSGVLVYDVAFAMEVLNHKDREVVLLKQLYEKTQSS